MYAPTSANVATATSVHKNVKFDQEATSLHHNKIISCRALFLNSSVDFAYLGKVSSVAAVTQVAAKVTSFRFLRTESRREFCGPFEVVFLASVTASAYFAIAGVPVLYLDKTLLFCREARPYWLVCLA